MFIGHGWSCEEKRNLSRTETIKRDCVDLQSIINSLEETFSGVQRWYCNWCQHETLGEQNTLLDSVSGQVQPYSLSIWYF